MRNPPTPRLLLAALVALALPAGAAWAQVYKYTDANGQVHYTDRAPSNATQIKGPSAPAPQPARPAAPPSGAAPADGAPPPTMITPEQQQQVQRDVAAARAEQCKKAKEAYDQAIRAQRMYRTNEKGEREYISAAEADQTRLQIKADVDSSCGGG